MTCFLCDKKAKDSALLEISSKADLETASFLKRRPCQGQINVCQPCHAKILAVAGLQIAFSTSETNLSKRIDVVDDEDEKENDFFDEDELNEMSTFYAENDSDEDQTYLPPSKASVSLRRAKNDSMLACQLCTSSLRRVATLRRHYISQHQYEPTLAVMAEEDSSLGQTTTGTFSCKECADSFSDKNVLIKHILYSHVNHALPVFKCKKCDRSYRYERDLRTHQERMCKAIVGSHQTCRYCQKKCNSAHVRSHETFAHKCRFCDHVAKDRAAKIKHLNDDHADALTDVCGECGERFETQTSLIRHQKRVHAKDFVQCPKANCKLMFPKGGIRLKKHLANFHNPENEMRRAGFKFECPQCKLKIRTLSLLKSHIAMKHNANAAKAKCPFCDFSVIMKRRSDINR